MSKIRCFCAVDISGDIKDRILDFRDEIKGNFGKVSWTKREGMHITLKFFGDQEESKIDEIKGALSEVSKDFSKVNIELGCLGFFPGFRRPRVIWVGLNKGEGELIDLKGMIDDMLVKIKIPRDGKRFKPHLTLGRIRNPEGKEGIYRDLVMKNEGRAFGSFIADRLFFIQSILKPEGAEYIRLGAYEFKKQHHEEG